MALTRWETWRGRIFRTSSDKSADGLKRVTATREILFPLLTTEQRQQIDDARANGHGFSITQHHPDDTFVDVKVLEHP